MSEHAAREVETNRQLGIARAKRRAATLGRNAGVAAGLPMLLRAAGNKAVAGLVADHRADPVRPFHAIVRTDGLAIQRMSVEDLKERNAASWDEDSVREWDAESRAANIGHGIAKHVDITWFEVIRRLDTGDTQGDDASRFVEGGADTIAGALNAHRQEIRDWANDTTGANALTIRHKVGELSIESYSQGASYKGAWSAYVGPATVYVCLNRRRTGIAGAPLQYYMVTAFPKPDPESRKEGSRGQQKHWKRESARAKKKLEEEIYGKGK
jgi:hypothetical protein